jgi:hypothetical protein
MDPYFEDEFEEDGGSDFVEHAMALAQGLLDLVGAPDSLLGDLARPPAF